MLNQNDVNEEGWRSIPLMMRTAASFLYLTGLWLLLTSAPISASPPMLSRERGVRLPFEHYYGLIFLLVHVNGSEPMSFVLDTGASLTIINESRATALGLTLRDRQRIAGRDGGEGSINLAFAKGVAIDMGFRENF